MPKLCIIDCGPVSSQSVQKSGTNPGNVVLATEPWNAFANTKYMENNPKEAESLCSQMIAWVAIRASKQHSSQIRVGENCAIQ